MFLPPVDEDWSRALAIVAHPDDLEFGAASAVARWTAQEKVISYCMVTSGEAGIDSLPPTQAGPLREAEQMRSARVVGVHKVEFLRLPDGVLEYGIELRRAIARVIRQDQPEIVITGNFREHFPGGALNQADHIAVGRAVLDGVRDAGNRWVFSDQLDDDLQPWNGVRQLLVSGSPHATHGVDTTEFFTLGVDSLKEHHEYIKGLNWDFDPKQFLEELSSSAGKAIGTRYGATFEVIPLGFDG